MFDLLKMIVEFTPTEKDDELLDRFEAFIENNPELIPVIMSVILKLARHK